MRLKAAAIPAVGRAGAFRRIIKPIATSGARRRKRRGETGWFMASARRG
jgi:hypothetical protein